MANIEWYVRVGSNTIQIPDESGIGFFGAGGFGYSIKTGLYNETCYITDSGGVTEGPECVNNKYIDESSVLIWGTSDPHPLVEVPNDKATINLRFVADSSVEVQNCWVTACDRYNATLSPDLNVFLAEICNSSTVYVSSAYSDSTWTQVYGNSSILNISNSPGTSGQYAAQGITGSSTQHDWYLCISVQPTSGGNKYFALYAEVEYI